MDRRRLLTGLAAAPLLAGAGPVLGQIAAIEPWATLRSTTPLPTPKETGRQKIGDVELYYAIYGKGAPVVLLHPGLGHADYWANQVGPLSQVRQVVLVDLRGHGRSTRGTRPLSYGRMADDVGRLIQKLNIGKPAVVGWGDGGVVALELAMRHPGRVSEIVLFGSGYSFNGLQPGVDKKQTFVQYVHKTAADYKRLSPTPDAFGDLFLQLETLWASAPNYTAAQLGELKTATTVVIAEHDEWIRLDHAEEMARMIPGSRVVAMPNVSHFAPWQAPKAFNDTIRLALDY